jgi:hypothetical protein
MLKEIIEETKYYACESSDEIDVTKLEKDDIIRVTDTGTEYKFDGEKMIENFTTINRNGSINIKEPVQILKSNMARTRLILQNNGIEPILLKFGNEVTDENYDYILKPSSRRKSGDGGVFISDSIKLFVTAMSETGESTLSVVEEVNL